jgi:branched-subunit amino acid aminotransferase/4-amino-4-deoxychorismate lyase
MNADKSERVYLNGELIADGDARVSVSNPALLHGVGLFETLRAYGGVPFRLDAHVDRLRDSAKQLDMAVDDAAGRIPEAVAAVLDANRLAEARLRITVTPPAGATDDGGSTLLVTARPVVGYPPELYDRGMTVYVCTRYRQSRHDPLIGHKTTCYLPRLLALRDAQERQCGEALWFTPDNLLAEGSISNVFIVKGGRLRTPSLDTPVLAGVTRAAVIELAGDDGISVEQVPCTIDDLLDADEVFLTNAVMEVMPVTRVERRAIADEQVGPVTRRLADAYQRLCGQVSAPERT